MTKLQKATSFTGPADIDAGLQKMIMHSFSGISFKVKFSVQECARRYADIPPGAEVGMVWE